MLPADVLAELEPAPEPVAVWPELWPAVQAFDLCLNQWRIGPQGVIGLDQACVLRVLALLRLKPRAQVRALRHIAVMEAELVRWAADNLRPAHLY